MAAEDAWSAELKRLVATSDPDPLALDGDTAERLLDGDLSPDQAPPGYAEVAAVLAATVAAPVPAELAGQEAALAELRAVTRPRRVAVARRVGKAGRRRRVGLVVAVAVGALTGGVAAAATGQLPTPIRDAARSIITTGAAAIPNPSPKPGRQPAPHAGTTDAGGATSDSQGARPAGGPGSTAMTDPGDDDRCQASRDRKGADKHTTKDAATSRALADGTGGADKVAPDCPRSLPGGTGTSGQEKPTPAGNHGHGQGGDPPPSTDSKPGRGQGGPPPSSGGNPEPGRPPETGPHSR
jgi:hypothetical protein